MAATIATPSTTQDTIIGDLRITTREVTFDSSYPTGGEPLTAANLGLTYVSTAIATLKTAATGSVTQVWYDIANAKLKAYTAAAEVADTTNIASVVAQVVAIGK